MQTLRFGALTFGLQGGPVALETVPVVQPKDLKPGQALVRVMCMLPAFPYWHLHPSSMVATAVLT